MGRGPVNRTQSALIAVVALAIIVSACDVVGPTPASAPFSNALRPGESSDTPEENSNRDVVLRAFQATINDKDFAQAEKYFAPNYRDHDPGIDDGRKGLARYISELRTEHPEARADVKRAMTYTDYVILHTHYVSEPGTLGYIAGDIFKLQDGLIIEHWDVRHPVPDKPNPDNPHTPFD
jgi:predicted SnoaL-like aldol condensation-catalyzing enzyme